MDKVKQFNQITEFMNYQYIKKNADYGDSFGTSINKYGATAGLVRIYDKFERANNLLIKKQSGAVKDETVADTLIDMASYCIMLAMELGYEPKS